MSDQMITPENLSAELLRPILEAAYMEVSVDSDGDLLVKDRIRCFVIPNRESKDRIKLLAQFGFAPSASQLERLEMVNKINADYIMVKSTVRPNDGLRFEYDVMVGGGLTSRNFVLTLKRFLGIPIAAIGEYGRDLVA
jgi:hypothetical protein